MRKRFEMIVNPVAGTGEAELLVESLARELRSAGHSVGVFRTRGADDARQHASRLRDDDVSAVMVAGGDGTVSEAIDGLIGNGDNRPHPPMAILPIGTENLLGKFLRARASVVQAETTLCAGRVWEMDVPQVARPAGRGDGWDRGGGPRNGAGHLLIVAGIGFDAEVVHRLARSRHGNINYANYLAPIVKTLIGYRFPVVRVEADGELLCEEPALVFVGNIPRYALGLGICRRARADDGLLDVVIYKCREYFELIRHSVRTLVGAHVNHRRVVYRQVRCVDIRADQPVALQVDGDEYGELPVRFCMTGQRVRMLLPPKRR